MLESFDKSGVVTLGVVDPLFKTALVVTLLALFAGNITLLLLLLFLLLTAILLEGVVEVTLFILQVAVETIGTTLLFLLGATAILLLLLTFGELTTLFGFVTWETVEVTLLGLVAWVTAEALLLLFELFEDDDADVEVVNDTVWWGPDSIVVMITGRGGGLLLVVLLLFVVVTVADVHVLFVPVTFFSPRSQYVVSLPFPLKE